MHYKYFAGAQTKRSGVRQPSDSYEKYCGEITNIILKFVTVAASFVCDLYTVSPAAEDGASSKTLYHDDTGGQYTKYRVYSLYSNNRRLDTAGAGNRKKWK